MYWAWKFKRQARAVAFGCIAIFGIISLSGAQERPRIRDLGIKPGVLPTGPLNAITDVAGVKVGHRSLIRDDDVRTGVTAIIPHEGNVFQKKPPAAVFVGNGFGKAAGFLQVQELGNLETPIVLTNTLSVGRAMEAVVQWTLNQPGNEQVQSVNALIGETNDGYLNDIRGMHVTTQDVTEAIESATDGPVAEGSIGAGVGTRCLGFKGGIGTSSRELPESLGGYTVGVLVQTNFGGVLSIDGHPIGEQLGIFAYRSLLAADDTNSSQDVSPGYDSQRSDLASITDPTPDGSVMIVVATDAPLSSASLERVAKRAVLGLSRTGSFISNGSGDFVIAFSTRNLVAHESPTTVVSVETLTNEALSPIFLATVEAVEEAVYNSLTRATSVTGRNGHRVEAIPIDSLQALLDSAQLNDPPEPSHR